MLLLVKSRFADAIQDGTKTLEIRAGSRYRNIRPGDAVSINGQFRRRVVQVELCAGSDLIARLRGRFHRAGFADEQDAREAIGNCYPELPEVFYLLHLSE